VAARQLLELLRLEKALFELQYELDYRPDWVRIPLMGILHLIRGDDSSGAVPPAHLL
jgi:maltose alpha-D-glucosyltransferase/alpha-amylase